LYGCHPNAALFNGDVSGWAVGAVTTTAGTFLGAVAFNRNLAAWDTSAIESMYRYCYLVRTHVAMLWPDVLIFFLLWPVFLFFGRAARDALARVLIIYCSY